MIFLVIQVSCQSDNHLSTTNLRLKPKTLAYLDTSFCHLPSFLIKNIISFLTCSYFTHHMIHEYELCSSGTDLNCTANPIIYDTALSFLHHIISV